MRVVSLSLIVYFICSISLSAQSNLEEVEYFQSVFGMEKKAVVAAFIKTEGEAGNKFWKLYDEYEEERKALGKQRIDLLNKYVDKHENLTDKQLEEMIAEFITLKKKTDKLIIKYYKKIMKDSSGRGNGAKFYQIENYFLSAIRFSILDGIPAIGND